MPKRTDIHSILIIGSGPIVIGQACEFDYSGTQACKALKEEGYRVVLVNSNPATIMTDPELADATYIEPITADFVERIIAAERPDALLPTLGGQTGLNTAIELERRGVLKRYGVRMIGANSAAIHKAEDRELFKKAMADIGLETPRSMLASTMAQARRALEQFGLPLVIRPSFTLGGTGGGIARTRRDFERIVDLGLKNSMIHKVLIEECVIGWKEYELEVMRDCRDNVVIVCAIENLDPMGVHTGDSITVAPAQTLTDREYQAMRDAAIAVIREIGVDTGGSNIQFAVDPRTGRMVVIEMNPRVSRSSALASKATGFPIARIAAKLAVGYTLDEIPNDITRKTPACFEPAIDYCVVKIPRFTFEKFPEAQDTLGISMKSVGETMAVGRTFKEALQKGLRGLEIGHTGLDNKLRADTIPERKLLQRLREPNASRIFYLKYALQKGWSVARITRLTGVDPWFIENIAEIVRFEREHLSTPAAALRPQTIRRAKRLGFSDAQLAAAAGTTERAVRARRIRAGILPTYKLVDTCAAEFEAHTPYYYSTYEQENEALRGPRRKIMILGGGPNRIGQGIEFDYCCCHASFALRELGYETIMVNSNPETVSTDFDTSDKLYFEPLTFEDVMNIVDNERPDGVIVQFGGQTPLNLAGRLHRAGVPILGTSVESIDLAEDRRKFARLLSSLGITQPPNATALTPAEAVACARRIGYPVLVRPSYVLGGRAMRIVYDEATLREFIGEVSEVSPGQPILIDKFLEDAGEVDVDAVSDGRHTVIGGIMEHIEEAGVHSGDSACVLPPHTLSDEVLAEIRRHTLALARALRTRGLLNIQFAVRGSTVYILEANPRASRTVPFVSKATGVPLAKIAARAMVGIPLRRQGFLQEPAPGHIAVKESVFPFSRFSGVDIILGPEMKSTGEVMGIDRSFGAAFSKAQVAAGQALPSKGAVFISVRNADKRNIVFIAKRLHDLGFTLLATAGTAKVLRSNSIPVEIIGKITDGDTTIPDRIRAGRIQLIINTPTGGGAQNDMKTIRSLAVMHGVPCITTLHGAQAAVNGMETVLRDGNAVQSIQRFTGAKKR